MLTEQIIRALDMAHLWVINDIIHSWIDPVFAAGCFAAGGYALYRGIKWMVENA